MMDVMDANTLLAHRDFVARIARKLIDDESQVDDVVQDTFAAALETRVARPRAWLARVARNLSVDRLRRRASRERRERAAARAEGVTSTDELAARVSRQQQVVAAVLNLDEPYRAVVLLRFYEELPPREIALRLELPVNTVRTRLRRALNLLRGKLDRAMLLPLALAIPATRSAAAVAGTVLTMKKTLVLLTVLVAAVALATSTTMRWLRSDEGASERSGHSAALRGSEETGRDADPVPAHLAGVVTGVLVGDLPAECEDAGGVTMTVFAGRREIHRELARPGMLRIVYRHEGRGRKLVMSGPRIVTKTFALADRKTDIGEVHLDRAVSFGGRVWGPGGKPLEGAIVFWNRTPSTEPTDRDGRYRIEIPGFVLINRNREGDLQGEELFVEWKGRWGGGFAAKPSGFELKYDFTATLEDPLRLQFPGRQGKRLILRPLPRNLSATPPPVVSETTVDEQGIAVPHWPPWIEGAYLTLDGIQMVLNRSEVVATDPYGVETDPANTIQVQMRVTPPGARIGISGLWSPDGLRVQEDDFFWQVELGATEVALFGIAPDEGPITWRFAGERKGRGVYLPSLWRAEYIEDGERRIAYGRFKFNMPKDVPIAGGSLPPLDLAKERGDGRSILVAGVDSCEGVVYLKNGKEAQRERALGQQSFATEDGGKVLSVTFEANDFDEVEMHFLAGDRLVTMSLGKKAWSESVKSGRILRPAISKQRVRATVVVRDAENRPARAVVVTCLVLEPYRIARTMTDRAGRAVLDLPDGGARMLAATDPVTGQGAMLDHWAPGGRTRTLRMRKPKKVRFRVLTPKGKPLLRGGGMLWSPGGIAGYFAVRAGRDGWHETPQVVAEFYTLKIARYWGPGVSAHITMPLRDVKDGQTLRMKETKR